MANLIFGLFVNRENAEQAVSELNRRGYNSDEISIIMREGVIEGGSNTTAESVAGGAVSGATTGGVLGGIAGLLIGLGAIAIPGVGGLLIGGPIAAALGLTGAAATTVSGAVTGALAGGLVGALVNLGIPKEQATIIEESIKEGAILVATAARDSEEEESLREIFEVNGADQVNAIALNTRRSESI